MLCLCFKYGSGLVRHARGKVDYILLPHLQKPRESLPMHAKVYKRESKANNEHTVAVLCQRHDFIL